MTTPAEPSELRLPRRPLDIEGESRTALVRRARRIGRRLTQMYPDAKCELDYRDAYELLVATILSAQCTDVRVNLVTPALFEAYPDPVALAAADRSELEELIRSTGFFRAKANSLLGMAAKVVTEFDGEIPGTLDELVTLPGAGRKTANVVLGNAFGVPGITVDTHIGRLARRFGWTEQLDPVKAEHEIGALFQPADWTMLCHRMIFHGRRVCMSRKPACGACALAGLCPSFGLGPTDPEAAAKLVKGPVAQVTQW